MAASVTSIRRKPTYLEAFRKTIEYADRLARANMFMGLLEESNRGGRLTILDTASEEFESFGVGERRSSTEGPSLVFARNLKADTFRESSLFAIGTVEGAAIRLGNEIWSFCGFEREMSMAFLLVILYVTNLIRVEDAQRMANQHKEAADIVDWFHLFTAPLHASVSSLKIMTHA